MLLSAHNLQRQIFVTIARGEHTLGHKYQFMGFAFSRWLGNYAVEMEKAMEYIGIEGEYGQRTSIVISTCDKHAHHDQRSTNVD